MKNILLFFLIIIFTPFAFSQNKLDKKLLKANTYYKSGDTEKAIKYWTKVEGKADHSSATYGKVLRNFLYFYSQQNKERKTLEYYHKLMKFNLNTIEKKEDIGRSFLNIKYHATLQMASFYKKRGNYREALSYVNKADHSLTYRTNSISVFSNQKIDLAFWKYYIYLELEEEPLALSTLLQRAFEYNYKAQYTNWYLQSDHNNEYLIPKMILEEEKDIEQFKNDLDVAIENLQVDRLNQLIIFKFRNTDYRIHTQKDLSVLGSQHYLKESVFYKTLRTRVDNIGVVFSKKKLD